MNRLALPVAGLLVLLLLPGMTGCSVASPQLAQPSASAPPQPALPESPPAGGLPVRNGITGQAVTLPNGTRLITTSADLPDVAKVHPEILGIGGPGGNPVTMAAGNHVEEIRQEEVFLPIGKAYLAVVVRGQPSAANSSEKTHELWLIAVRKHPSRTDMQLAYAIRGVITGDEAKAKEQMLDLGRHWELPTE